MSETITRPSLYATLVAAASSVPGFHPRTEDEDLQSYLHRLVNAIGNTPIKVWEALPEAAQIWHDESIEGNSYRDVLDVPEGFPVYPPVVEAPIRRRAVQRAPMPVYDELLAAVKAGDPAFADKHSRETDQMYLSRLLLGLGEVLPAGASQALENWVNNADAAQQESKPLAPPDGYVLTGPKPRLVVKAPEPKVAEPVHHTNGVNGTDQQAAAIAMIESYNAQLAAGTAPTRRKARAAANVAAAKVKSLAQRRVGRTAKPDSTTALIRDAITANETTTLGELKQLLAMQGKTPSLATITTTRASHLAAISSLRRAGRLLPAQ